MTTHKSISSVKSSLYRNIAISFIVLSIAIAVTIFYITFSWATIIVSPQKIQLSDSFVVTVGKDSTSFVDERLFGRVIRTSLDGSGTFSATAKEQQVQKAHGMITIVNTTGNAQPLRATTRLLSPSGFLFRTDSFIVVPAKGKVTVPVVADSKGSIEGLDLSRFTIPGLWQGLQKSIYGKDFEVNVKGDEEVSIVTQQDIDRAKEEVFQKVKNKFSLLLDIPDSSFQPKKSVKISDVVIKDFTASQKAGDRARDFTVALNAVGTGVVFDESDEMALMKERAKNQLGIGYEFVFGDDDRISHTLENLDEVKAQAHIRFDIQAGKVRGEDTSQFVKSNLTGLSKSQIKEYFSSYGDIAATDVRFYPFWVQRAPLLTDHIHILFQK